MIKNKEREKKSKTQLDSYEKANSNNDKGLHFAKASINCSIKRSSDRQTDKQHTPAYLSLTLNLPPRPYSITDPQPTSPSLFYHWPATHLPVPILSAKEMWQYNNNKNERTSIVFFKNPLLMRHKLLQLTFISGLKS